MCDVKREVAMSRGQRDKRLSEFSKYLMIEAYMAHHPDEDDATSEQNAHIIITNLLDRSQRWGDDFEYLLW